VKIAVVADRIAWEERQLIAAASRRGLTAFWVDDGDLCAGPRATGVPAADVHLMRSRSYPRCVALAGLLADRGDRVVNSWDSIVVCHDKLTTARALQRGGLPVVDFRLVLTRRDLARAIDDLGLPCVVKPPLGGLGRRALLVRDRDLVDAAYDYVEYFAQGLDRVLIAQPYLSGGDERVVVAGSTVMAAYRRRPGSDWRANLAVGGSAEPVEVDDELLALVAATSRATGAELYALDLLRDAAGRRLVNEVNHVPMFRGAASVTGVDIAAEMIEYVMAPASSTTVAAAVTR
jgi:[lysine-biosynthesis-protein LysW]---L-2-aminoadipate ligase